MSALAPNLAVNNSNGVNNLRPGIPDIDAVISDHDELLEDQG